MEEKKKRTELGIDWDSSSCRFYMLEPREGSNACATARELMAFKEVEEVYVTEGSHGFIVKAKDGNGKEPGTLRSYIVRKTGSRFSHAAAHFSYKK